jgi:hypothetical protein
VLGLLGGGVHVDIHAVILVVLSLAHFAVCGGAVDGEDVVWWGAIAGSPSRTKVWCLFHVRLFVPLVA